jgi:N-acetylneuraminic acid mutarotase
LLLERLVVVPRIRLEVRAVKRCASLLVLLGLLTDAHPSAAANWSAVVSLPEARFGAAAAAAGDRLYLVGGFTSQTSAGVSSWDGLVWLPATPMLEARLTPGAASAGGAVFAVGGLDANGSATASAERLDPGSGVWSGVAPMPMARAAFAIGAIGGRLFVAGGQGPFGTAVPECFQFDPGANAWSPIAALTTPRVGVAGAVLDDRLWVIGGMDFAPSAAVERFDPQSNSWSSAAPLPEPLWFPVAAVLNGRVWVMGGMDASFQRSDRVYSAGSDGAWQAEASLPAALAVSAAGSLGNCLVVAGGMDASGLPSPLAFSQCAEVPPPPPPPPPSGDVTVEITPSTLNAASNGQWVSVRIVPHGWPATDIVVASLRLDGIAPDLSGPVSVSAEELTVKFPRFGLGNRPAGDYQLALTGLRSDGSAFEGTASLTVQGSSLQNKRRALRPQVSGPTVTGVVVSLDQPAVAEIDVLDLQGRIVDRLHHGQLAAGEFRIAWPAAGQSVARGNYFIRLRRPGAVDVMRIAVLR